MDESLELPPRGFRPRRRWLITVLDGLSWEGRTRVAGHLSGGKVTKKKKTLQEPYNNANIIKYI